MFWLFSRGRVKLFLKKHDKIFEKDAIIVTGISDYSLKDTFECGQCFRFVKLNSGSLLGADAKEFSDEYMTVVRGKLIFVAQRSRDELIFFGLSDDDFLNIAVPYFALDTDYAAIKADVIAHTDSEFLRSAAECAGGIRILRQEPWETVFSFIISQNNNIPRIKKIIRHICAAYGENLAVSSGIDSCPISLEGEKICEEKCRECGLCYSFPTATDVASDPDLLLPSRPGFRFKYLVDAAEKISSGAVDLKGIEDAHSYEYTLSELAKIKGVGAKVASCAALFAFSNLDAFPIDVWMRRAIDEYFGGELDPATLGEYAGVAQQYIFHYIRALSGEND